MNKKIILLIFLIIISIKNWAQFAGGDGSESNPYIISDATQLNNVRNYLSSNFIITNDINLSGTWTPIGTSGNPFKGYLNGDNHIISGLSINNGSGIGLFGYVNGGKIENINLNNVSISGTLNVGGLIGIVETSVNVNNCNVSGSITATGSLGGLIGVINNASTSSSPDVSITNCNNNILLTINTAEDGGGLIGRIYWFASATLTVDNCSVSGTVNPTTGSYYHHGGLIGHVYTRGTSNTIISSSFCTAEVPGNVNETGGLIGKINAGASSSVEVSNCYATGNVKGSSYIGGLIGMTYTDTGTSKVNLKNCYSTGDVTSSAAYCGGFSGVTYGVINIENCYAKSNVSSSGNYVGGFIGEASSYGITVTHIQKLKNCYATGNVNSNGTDSGGLIGCARYDFIIENCYATGNLNSKNNYAGGLVGHTAGYTAARQVIIKSSFASGNVESTGISSGGLIAYMETFSAVSNCYATGYVQGTNYVGGLVAYATGSISNCYATCNLNGGSTNKGGLVGYNSATISNCYFDLNTTGVTKGIGSGTGSLSGSTTSQLTSINTFNWIINIPENNTSSIESPWEIVDSKTYPFLYWQRNGKAMSEKENMYNIGYLKYTTDNQNTWIEFVNTKDITEMSGKSNYQFSSISAGAQKIYYPYDKETYYLDSLVVKIFPNIIITNGGIYSIGGVSESNIIGFNVVKKPEIINIIHSDKYCEWDILEAQVIVEDYGYPITLYEWVLDGVPIGANSDIITHSYLSMYDNGKELSVKVTNIIGSVSASTIIKVFEYPQAMMNGSKEICKGEIVEEPVFLTGEAPWTITIADSWGIHTIENIQYPVYMIIDQPNRNMSYKILNISDNNCYNDYPSAYFDIKIKHPETYMLSYDDYCWYGLFDDDWNNSYNWSVFDGYEFYEAYKPPDENTNVFILPIYDCPITHPKINYDNNNSCKNIHIESGLILQPNTTLDVKGDFLCYGYFVSDMATVIFSGMNTQNIKNTYGKFHNVIFDNFSFGYNNILLMEPTTINGFATFKHGIINIDTYGDIIFSDEAQSDGGSIYSFVNGSVTKIGSNDFLFPIGSVSTRDIGEGNRSYEVLGTFGVALNGEYAEISATYNFNNSGMPDWWNNGSNMDAGLHHVSDREHWLINSTIPLKKITLFWKENRHNNGEVCPHGFDNADNNFYPDDLTIAYWDNNKWIDAGQSSENSDLTHDDGYITNASVINQSLTKSNLIITLGSKSSNTPLPVELLSFKATCKNKTPIITWQTATETNNDYFILEKSIDLESYHEVELIKGAGNSNTITSYVYIDNDLETDEIYYRLKQVDYDGTQKIFETVFANCVSDSTELEIFPNPVYDDLHIKIKNWKDNHLIIEVINTAGQILHTEMIQIPYPNYQFSINLGELKPGLYFLGIISKENRNIKTFIKR